MRASQLKELEVKPIVKVAKNLSREEFTNKFKDRIDSIVKFPEFYYNYSIILSKHILKVVFKGEKYYGFLLHPNAEYSIIDGEITFV